MIELTFRNAIAIAMSMLGLFGVLIGVIWSMLNNKICYIVNKTKKNSTNIETLKEKIHSVETDELKMLNEITLHFIRKEECEKQHKTLLSQIKNNNA